MDLVHNIGRIISGQSEFTVYQGSLPTLDPPTGLVAQALSGGIIRLDWGIVPEAADYAVYRQAPGEGSLTLLGTSIGQVSLIDGAPDGTNFYTVATIRSANGQTSTGTRSLRIHREQPNRI